MVVFADEDYSEYFIEYDNDNNVVYISGLTAENYWIEVACEDEIAEPESYAWGVHDTLKRHGIFSTVDKVRI